MSREPEWVRQAIILSRLGAFDAMLDLYEWHWLQPKYRGDCEKHHSKILTFRFREWQQANEVFVEGSIHDRHPRNRVRQQLLAQHLEVIDNE